MSGGSHGGASPGDSSGWIAAIAEKHDRHSFISLFSHFAPKIKTYLLRQGLDPHTAEEVIQDTFLTVWRKAGQFDAERASAAAWIYAIARNRWLDLRRRQHPVAVTMLVVLEQDQPTPEQAVNAGQMESRLRGAIDNLPIEQAEVLRLCYFDELSHSEIARQLCLPLGTVKSRIRLASAYLKSNLSVEI